MKKLRVLLVDDEVMIREGFKQQLNNTYIQYEDGHREKLTERPPKQ